MQPFPPLRILFYLPSLGGGGAERLFASLASALVERGHAVLLAVDTDASENAGRIDERVEVARLGAGHATATLRLARLLLRWRPDVSMSALGGQNLKHFAAALLTGRLSRAVQTVHGFAEGEPRLLSQLSFRFLPVSSRVMARTVAVSDALRSDLVGRFGASRRSTVRIHNGVALGKQAGGARTQPPTIVACGRLTSDKNYPLLLRAFARVQRRDAQLAILGEGPERRSIEADVARLGLADRVRMPGFVDPAPFFDQGSCLAITSDREAFGLVVVEALAAGLPVVTTASGGPPEILGALGTVVESDETALAAALDAALSAPGDPAARQARAAEFSLARCADRYEQLFRQIVSR